MKITLALKSVYGQIRAYPADDTAQKFAALLGVKTLTRDHLQHIKALGYSVATVDGAKLEDLA